MNQNSENKQWMYGDSYRDALESYVNGLDEATKHDWLKDYILEYIENHMTNEQVQEYIDTGEW